MEDGGQPTRSIAVGVDGTPVFVLHTGGTIGMVDTPDGSAPVAGALGPYLDWIVETAAGELPSIAFLELDPPIDSANATPDSWRNHRGRRRSRKRARVRAIQH